MWGPTLAGRAPHVRSMLRTMERQALKDASSRWSPTFAAGGLAALKFALSGGNWALGGHFRGEIDAIADKVGVDAGQVLMANLAYDLTHWVGCSTIAAPTADGPLHARNLDWPFPRGMLRRHTTVVVVRNAPRGDWATVTWPGMFGVLSAVSRRFSATINYVQTDDDWTAKLGSLAGWPVSWALRRAFDEAKDFDAAVRLLCRTPLLSPVLFTLAGRRNDERVVIERGVSSYAVRGASRGAPVWTTNHYASPELMARNTDLTGLDTVERFVALSRALGRRSKWTEQTALALLSRPPWFRDDTQQQIVLRPRSGRLSVVAPGFGEVSAAL